MASPETYGNFPATYAHADTEEGANAIVQGKVRVVHGGLLLDGWW